MSVQTVSSTAVAHALTALRANRPLVHCLTNEVVQEITANVLLACLYGHLGSSAHQHRHTVPRACRGNEGLCSSCQ